MHSWDCHAAGFGLIATASPAPPPSTSPWVPIGELIIVYLGVGIALGWFVWWVARSRRDPLARAPHRGHAFRFDTILTAMCAYLVTATVLLGVAYLAVDDPPAAAAPDGSAEERIDAPTMGLVDGIAKLAAVGVCVVLAVRQFEGGARRFFFGRGRVAGDVLIGVVVALTAISVCQWIGQGTEMVFRRITPDYVFKEHETIEALRRPGQGLAAVWILRISAILVAPIAEEVFFRGLLQTALGSALRSRWAAVLITSVAFAAVHALPHHWPALIVLSVMIGVAYERTGALVAPIAIHMIFNANTLFWESIH